MVAGRDLYSVTVWALQEYIHVAEEGPTDASPKKVGIHVLFLFNASSTESKARIAAAAHAHALMCIEPSIVDSSERRAKLVKLEVNVRGKRLYFFQDHYIMHRCVLYMHACRTGTESYRAINTRVCTELYI